MLSVAQYCILKERNTRIFRQEQKDWKAVLYDIEEMIGFVFPMIRNFLEILVIGLCVNIGASVIGA